MTTLFTEISYEDLKIWRGAVSRAGNKVEWWLKNYGDANSKFSETEKAERRRDRKALRKLEDHLAAAENRARYGGPAKLGGSGARGE
jgi:hypothetical protein